MSRFFDFSFVTTLKNGTSRFPLAILSSFLTFILYVFVSEKSFEYQYQNTINHIILTLCVSFFIFITASLIKEKYLNQRNYFIRILPSITAILLNIFIYFTITSFSNNISFYQTSAIIIISIILIPLILSSNSRSFIETSIKLFVNSFISYLYSLVFMLCLMGLVLIIKSLFFTENYSKLYEYIFFLSISFFMPVVFISKIPKINEFSFSYPSVIKFIIKFIGIPFSFCYITVLYTYFLKTIFTLKIPNGIIVHIVIWFSIASFCLAFFSYLLEKESKSVSFFFKFMPKLIIPSLIFMGYALYIRVDKYGITESRYLIIATALFLFSVMIAISFRTFINWRNIFKFIIFIIIFIIFSPLNIFETSKLSQTSRLKNLLIKNKILIKNNILPNKQLIDSQKKEISEIIQYLDKNFQNYNIPFFKNIKKEDLTEKLGFNPFIYDSFSKSTYYCYSVSNNYIWAEKTKDIDYVVSINQSITKDSPLTLDSYKIYNDNNNFVIYDNEKKIITYSFNIENAILKLTKQNMKKYKGDFSFVKQEDLTITDNSSPKFNTQFNFNSINSIYNNDTFSSPSYSLLIVKIKIKE